MYTTPPPPPTHMYTPLFVTGTTPLPRYMLWGPQAILWTVMGDIMWPSASKCGDGLRHRRICCICKLGIGPEEQINSIFFFFWGGAEKCTFIMSGKWMIKYNLSGIFQICRWDYAKVNQFQTSIVNINQFYVFSISFWCVYLNVLCLIAMVFWIYMQN